jgi:hypothetical protein
MLSGIDLLSLKSHLTIRRGNAGQSEVFDLVRRRYIRATPEEFVRQLWITYLIEIKQYNPKLIAVERAFKVHENMRRFDLVLMNSDGSIFLLAEFKAPDVPISQLTFDQVAVYNYALQVPFALVSNGMQHAIFQIDSEARSFRFMESLPF